MDIRAFVARHSRVRLTPTQWSELIRQLGRRAGGVRESGAFLLAKVGARRPAVRRIVYYDDLDPASLNGGVVLRSPAYGKLWSLCRAEGMRVIADLHTHGGTLIQQSDVDQTNPTVAIRGHVAIVVPHLASRPIRATECGVHLYLGGHRWQSHLGRRAARVLYVGRWA